MICIAGKNAIAVGALVELVRRGWRERLVVCPNRTDTGVSTWQPSLALFARQLGVRVVQLDEVQTIDDLVFISLEFDRIIRPQRFRSSRLYNIHFSALPAYKGMYTSALPILHGRNRSGVTLHVIDHGIDTGPIIERRLFDIPDTYTARDLYYRYMDEGLKLFSERVDDLVGGMPDSVPQAAERSTYNSKAAIDYENLKIDLNDTADGVIRQLRAFSFREYQTPMVAGMEVGEWTVLPSRSLTRPGRVEPVDEDTLVVSTIDYQVELGRHRAWDWFDFTSGPDRRVVASLDNRYIDCRDAEGKTPLLRAVIRNDAGLCRALLDRGAAPDCGDMDGKPPLMYAEEKEDGDEIVSILLKYGANASKVDRFGHKVSDFSRRSKAIA